MNAAPCVAQATLLHLNQSPDVVAEVVAESPPAGCLRTLLVTAGDLSGKNAASTAATLAQVQVRKNRVSSSQAYLVEKLDFQGIEDGFRCDTWCPGVPTCRTMFELSACCICSTRSLQPMLDSLEFGTTLCKVRYSAGCFFLLR